MIEGAFGIRGAQLTDGDAEPFSWPVTLRSQDGCGVAQTVSDSEDSEHVECDLVDVNGDGVIDRVVGTSVWPGTATLDSGRFFTQGALVTLPGPLAVTTSTLSAGGRFVALF